MPDKTAAELAAWLRNRIGQRLSERAHAAMIEFAQLRDLADALDRVAELDRNLSAAQQRALTAKLAVVELRARIARLEAAVREHGKCDDCGGRGYRTDRHCELAACTCDDTGLQPWAREVLDVK